MFGSISNNEINEDSYGKPIGNPLNNAIQTQDNNNNNANNPFLSNSNDNSYGSPIPNKYVSPPSPAPQVNNGAFSAPNSYSGPIGEYTPNLTPMQNTRSENSGTVQVQYIIYIKAVKSNEKPYYFMTFYQIG